MFNKIYLLAFITLIASTANAGPKVYWPGYIDNSVCLEKAAQGLPSECGEAAFSNMNNHGSYTAESREFEFFYEWSQIWEHLNNEKPESNLSYIEVHMRVMISQSDLDNTRTVTKEDGLPLKTTNNQPTPYWLKGFGAGGDGAFDVEYRLCNKVNESKYDQTCKVEDKWIKLGSFTFDDIVDYTTTDWGKMVTLDRKQAIHGFRIKTGDPRFRLGFRGDKNSDVRSLVLPSINIVAKITAKNSAGNKIRDTKTDFTLIRKRTQTRLNHRKCYLTTDNQNVSFGKLYLDKNSQGKIGPEIERVLKLRCNAETENLQFGGHIDHVPTAGDYKDTQVSGSRVVHTVKSVSLNATSDFIDSKGVKHIGMTRDGASMVSDKLYVEGSLRAQQPCGVNGLLVGNNKPQGLFNDKLQANPIEDNNIPEHDYSKIYWKLCKNPGSMEAGKYTGNATITIEYQ